MTADAGSDTPEWLKREQELKDLVFKERSYKAEGWRREALLQDEIKNLREAIRRLADQDATLSVCEGNVIVEMDTLTDAERQAIDAAAHAAAQLYVGTEGVALAATLRALLERTK